MSHATRSRWIPPVIWAVFIEALTTWPVPRQLGDLPRNSDKLAHIAIYAVLGYLVARALDGARTRGAVIATAVAICACWGAIDEWHQLLIPWRSAELSDWYADAAGGVVGAVVWMLVPRFVPSRPV